MSKLEEFGQDDLYAMHYNEGSQRPIILLLLYCYNGDSNSQSFITHPCPLAVELQIETPAVNSYYNYNIVKSNPTFPKKKTDLTFDRLDKTTIKIMYIFLNGTIIIIMMINV